MSGHVNLIRIAIISIPGFAGVTAKGIDNEAVFSGPLRAFNLATWALIAAVNVSATALICLRLWIARRKSSTVLSQSKYKSTIIVVIECGALVTITTITMLVLYTAERAAGLVGIGISTQVAVRCLRWTRALSP